MFLSTHGGNHDRRGKRSPSKKTTLSSRVSLLSAITTSSGGSSKSGSTVTQEAVSRSRHVSNEGLTSRQPKRKAAPVKGHRRQSTGSISTVPAPCTVDVFAFLDSDQQNPVAELDTQVSSALHEESDLDSTTRSLHSDSGISIRDSSPDSLHYRPCPRSVLGPLKEEEPPCPARRNPTRSPVYYPSMGAGRAKDPEANPKPESMYDYDLSGKPEDFYFSPINPNNLRSKIRSGNAVAGKTPLDDQTVSISGYDLLAARLSEAGDKKDGPLPAYRRFTRLNHRILLQLQDEISQMEEDLATFDAADARLRHGSDGKVMPESRRLNLQWHGSELHARRLDLLGQIYVKVEQYNQALASFQKVMNITATAKQPDISIYRAWIDDNSPIAEAERTFLDDPKDLLTLCSHKACAHCERDAAVSLQPDTSFVLICLLVYLIFSNTRWLSIPFLLFVGFTMFALRTDISRNIVKLNSLLAGFASGAAVPADVTQSLD